MHWQIVYTYMSGNTLETKTVGSTVLSKYSFKEALNYVYAHLPLDDIIELKVIEITEQIRDQDIQTIARRPGGF